MLKDELGQFLMKMVNLAHWRVHFQMEEREEALWVDFSGEDAGVLLSHHAEVLNALEYLCNRVFEKFGRRIILDCEDYRSMRENELLLMAQVAVENVKRQGRPHKFSPMSAEERRIIHLALADDPAVRTESEGTGENRKVVIFPK